MNKVATGLLAMVVIALAPESSAQCDCETGPCEEITLQSVAARDPEASGFGAVMPAAATVPTSRSSGMEIRLSSVDRERSTGWGVLLMLATLFVPVIGLVRRCIGSTGPLLALKLTERATAPEPDTKRSTTCAPVVSIESRARRVGAEPTPEPA